jgi:phage gpG-like protein
MTIKGDFAKLARLHARLKKIATSDTRVRLANAVGAAAMTGVELGFAESRDPYGQAWAPLKLRRGGKPLLDTGRLLSSFSYQARVAGLTFGTNFIGARVHQYGAVIVPKRAKWLRYQGRTRRTTGWIFSKRSVIPRRQMVPVGRFGPIWSKSFVDAGKRFMSRIMKG